MAWPGLAYYLCLSHKCWARLSKNFCASFILHCSAALWGSTNCRLGLGLGLGCTTSLSVGKLQNNKTFLFVHFSVGVNVVCHCGGVAEKSHGFWPIPSPAPAPPPNETKSTITTTMRRRRRQQNSKQLRFCLLICGWFVVVSCSAIFSVSWLYHLFCLLSLAWSSSQLLLLLLLLLLFLVVCFCFGLRVRVESSFAVLIAR